MISTQADLSDVFNTKAMHSSLAMLLDGIITRSFVGQLVEPFFPNVIDVSTMGKTSSSKINGSNYHNSIDGVHSFFRSYNQGEWVLRVGLHREFSWTYIKPPVKSPVTRTLPNNSGYVMQSKFVPSIVLSNSKLKACSALRPNYYSHKLFEKAYYGSGTILAVEYNNNVDFHTQFMAHDIVSAMNAAEARVTKVFTHWNSCLKQVHASTSLFA